MRKLLVVSLLFLSSQALAAESEVVALSLPPAFATKVCPAPVWKGQTVRWKGVKDARENTEIGRQTRKKGKDVVSVGSSAPIETVVDGALKDLFLTCGLRLVDGGAAELEMSGLVEEFYAGVDKGLLTGKGMAHSKIQFLISRKGSNSERMVEVGYEMETKKIRQKDLKQLEATLNELLARTLEQVPKLDGLKNLSF